MGAAGGGAVGGASGWSVSIGVTSAASVMATSVVTGGSPGAVFAEPSVGGSAGGGGRLARHVGSTRSYQLRFRRPICEWEPANVLRCKD